MRILGLDLSITSPGFCIMDVNEDDGYRIRQIDLHGFTKTDKWKFEGDGLIIHQFPKDYNQHPSHYRPTLVYDIVEPYLKEIDYVAIEDYAFGAKGKVFDLAEFAGSMKNYMYDRRIPIKKFPPMTVKLCAAGSGAADKVLMGMSFKASSLSKLVNPYLFMLPEYDNPQEDLVDAIYMANTLRAEICYMATGAFPVDLGMKVDNCATAILLGKKGAKTKPSIEHPLITFGAFSRVKKEKKVKKVAEIESKVPKKREPKKKLIVLKE